MDDGIVLIVEDDLCLQEALSDTLSLEGYETISTDSAEQALIEMNKRMPGIIISDINLGKMSGYDLLHSVKKRLPDLPVLLITAHGDIENAVQAMRDGAADYLTKPFEPSLLVKKVSQYITTSYVPTSDPIAEDPRSQELFAMALRVANSDATVMITGESGTGKEVLARYIHQHSPRSEEPFIAVNCAAIPENMLEATLFGYEKGAFTGAYQASPGKFERAQNGTLLLDEISEMELSLQSKLLRVLQEREIERLGGRKIISLDVRVIATSNRNMWAEVQEGNFREDLYYRLNVFPLAWLPLSKRPLDILPLAKHLLKVHSSRNDREMPILSSEAAELLTRYYWPGNVREMENVIQRALILQPGNEIKGSDIQIENQDYMQEVATERNRGTAKSQINSKPAINKPVAPESTLKDQEGEFIMKALEEANYNRTETASKLGISPRTLRYKLAKLRDQGYTIPR